MIKVLYAGSPDAAAKTFEILNEKAMENGFEIAGVLTNPPSAKGRHKELVPTAVGLAARKAGIPVLEPEKLDGSARDAVAALQPDMLVCFAYGHIFGPKFMELFRFGGINLHPSALPQFRGCTPVNAAILNGLEKTAFSVQKVSAKMDEGNILAQVEVCLDGTENAAGLLDDAAEKGADLICGILNDTSKNNAVAEGCVQSGEASYTGMITKEMARIDWNCSAKEIDCMIRGYAGDPGAWTTEGLGAGNAAAGANNAGSGASSGAVLKILCGYGCNETGEAIFKANENIYNGAGNALAALSAFSGAVPGTVCHFEKSRGIFVKCGQGFVCITELQRQGKNAMKYKDFMNGARNFVGGVLS